MDVIDFRTRPRHETFYRLFYPKLAPVLEDYGKVFDAEGKAKPRLIPTTFDESVEEMRQGGVSQGVIFAGGGTTNEEVYETCQKYPDAYFGLATADPRQGTTKAYAELEKAYEEYGLLGLNLGTWMINVYPNDPRMFPFYALSEKLGKVVQIPGSTHFIRSVPLDICDPLLIDQIASEFPDLRIVISHGGIGFGTTAITVANHCPNVYIEFSGLHPRFLPKEMIGAINSILKHKSLFGSDYPALGYDIIEAWKEVIDEENHELFFHDNAVRALGLN